MDAEGGVGVLDSDGLAGVADAGVDLLAGDDDAAAVADAPVDSYRIAAAWGELTGGPRTCSRADVDDESLVSAASNLS